MIRINAINTNTKGNAATLILSRLVPPMPIATYKDRPTGGVIVPTERLTHMMTPSNKGSMPRGTVSESNMGVKMINAEAASRKHPTMSSKILINSRVT